MWVEQRPKEGDIVKVHFAEWTKIGTKIGVFLKYFHGKVIVDFGDRKLYLDGGTTFYTYIKKTYSFKHKKLITAKSKI